MHDVIIIGSGPAGYTAAIYSARANLSSLILASEPKGQQMPGGQLMFTTEVENFPGFPEGVGGPDLMELMKKQALRFGTEMIEEDAEEADFKPGGPFRVRSQSGWHESRAVIVATGAGAKWLQLPNESKFRNRGLSACAVCDGFFYKGQDVAIVGGGDTAAEEASYLANICNKVTMLVRKDHMRASKAMQHRVESLKNIDLRYNTEVDEILGDQVVEGLRMVNNKTGEKEEIPITGFFVAIGHKPNTDIFKGQLEMDATGYLITKGKSTKTSKPGVFASGDVQDKEYRQAVTAAGTGCMAALDAERYLATIETPQEVG